MFNGSVCRGHSEESDVCYEYNSNDCASYNDTLKYLPMNLKYTIMKYLDKTNKSFRIGKESSNFTIDCDSELKRDLKFYYPSLQVEWLFKGRKVDR